MTICLLFSDLFLLCDCGMGVIYCKQNALCKGSRDVEYVQAIVSWDRTARLLRHNRLIKFKLQASLNDRL